MGILWAYGTPRMAVGLMPSGLQIPVSSITCTSHWVTERERGHSRWVGYTWGGQQVKLWLDGWGSCVNERSAYYELESKPIQVSAQMHSPVAIRPSSCGANMLFPSFIQWWVMCCCTMHLTGEGITTFTRKDLREVQMWAWTLLLTPDSIPGQIKTKSPNIHRIIEC